MNPPPCPSCGAEQPPLLTPRQAQIARAVLEGRDQETVADTLKLSRGTIAATMSAVRAKAGVHNNLQLIATPLGKSLVAPRITP